MKKIIMATVLLVLFVVPSLAQKNNLVKKKVTRSPILIGRVHSETAHDAKLEAAIFSFLYESVEDYKKYAEEDGEVQYYYNRVDLDGDKKPEVLAFIYGRGWCGSGGCSTLVFQQVKGEYKLVSEISLTGYPIIVSEHKTHGWKDLIMLAEGDGPYSDYYTVLRFDGQTYPQSPGAGDAMPLKTKLRGTEYLVTRYPVGSVHNLGITLLKPLE